MTHVEEVAAALAVAAGRKPVGLEEYYSEAGADYGAWSDEFNMHFGYFRAGMNPFAREAMLEEMNAEVLRSLRISVGAERSVLDLGCGLGATLRSFAAKMPAARLTGITKVPWQVKEATRLNAERGGASSRIEIVEGDYEASPFADASIDGAYALESACHARGADKRNLLEEARRVLRPGGRLVVVDGFLRGSSNFRGPQEAIYRNVCDCWVIDTFAELDGFVRRLGELGFRDVEVKILQWRVAPSTFHIPWVTLKFLLRDVVFGKRRMTRARWNNVLAPLLLPLVSWPVGPLVYASVSATRGSDVG